MKWLRFASALLTVLLTASVSVFIACTGDFSAAPTWPANGVEEARQVTSDVTVGSLNPDSASQDTTLDVVISGTGFVPGSIVTWQLAGVEDPSQIRTNSTRYVNSKQLVSNITISPTATVGKWDVKVMAGTKGGIGTEAFTVKSNQKPIPDATPDFFLSNDQSYLLRGDGSAAFLEGSTSPYSGMSRYTDGQCGDHTELFNSPSTGSGDAILASPWATHSKCPSYPRGIRLTYALINADGSITGQGSAQVKTFVNVAQIQSPAVNGHPAFYIPVGSTELRGMNLQDDNGKCITLRFRPVLRDGTVAGADDVTVTRTAADTWIVRTQPDDVDALTGQVTHHDKAWCESSGNLYHLPTMFIIHNAVPLFP